MNTPRTSRGGEPLRRRSRETPPIWQRTDGPRAWQCDPRRGRMPAPPSVQLVVVTAGADTAPLRTRLSPPYSPEQAAFLANAAVTDTLRAVEAMPAGLRVPGWATVTGGLGEAFADARLSGGPSLLVSTEIPQVCPDLLTESAARLRTFDAVLGPTTGGGWWAFGVRHPGHAAELAAMPGLLTDTASLTLAALRLGLRVAMLCTLQEMTSGADAHAVARGCPPGSSFAAAVARLAPARARPADGSGHPA